MTQTVTAQDLFRSAYENRYTWDQNFPGYRAKVTMKSGEEQFIAQALVKADLSFEVSGVEDPKAKKSIQGQLWEMTIHRVKHSFEESHGKNTFAFGAEDETGAKEILIGGASEGNSYKLRDNTVCFVNRRIRDKIVNINTLKTFMTESGYLSAEYESFYLDPETREPNTSKTNFVDNFEKVGNYYLLVKRTIKSLDAEGNTSVVEYNFTDIELLA